MSSYLGKQQNISSPRKGLPLGWLRANSRMLETKHITLDSNTAFVYEVDVPNSFGSQRVQAELQERFPNGYILRGVHDRTFFGVSYHKNQWLCLGQAASIDLRNWSPSKSLLKLVQRGENKTTVRKVGTSEAVEFFEELRGTDKQARLKYLYRDVPSAYTPAFAAMCKTSRAPLALVTISRNSKHGYHLEIMKRHPNAPVGTMEALLFRLVNFLKENRQNLTFSLGEVPFCAPAGLASEKLINFAAKAILPAYDFNGLYNFKNKFKPYWQPIYWYGWPKLKLTDLYLVALKIGLAEMVVLEYLSHIFYKGTIRKPSLPKELLGLPLA